MGLPSNEDKKAPPFGGEDRDGVYGKEKKECVVQIAGENSNVFDEFVDFTSYQFLKTLFGTERRLGGRRLHAGDLRGELLHALLMFFIQHFFLLRR